MDRRRRVSVFLCLALFAFGMTATLAAQAPPRPELKAERAARPPVIDGTLAEEEWQAAPLTTGDWLSYNPLHGDRVPQLTTVWFTYDSDYLYFAFKCDDPEPAGIKTSVTRRDNIWQDDWVGVSLDALGTGQLAYHMMVNPSGVQLDMLNSVAGNEDPAPDWIWDSAGRLTDTGYVVEMRLPLQSIRFKGGADTRMGLMFFRSVSRLGISVSWPALSPGVWVFERHASLRYDDMLQPRRTRELLPSATYARNQTRESPTLWSDADARTEVGFSAKVGLTPTITLDATVNPDFSQVESDAFQVEVNQRFPVFFGEKRPFFMEGTGIFALAGALGGDNNLRTAVHTRRIVDPIFGAKLTGTAGRVTFGALSAVDEAAGREVPEGSRGFNTNRYFTIGRAQYSLGPNNYVGALFTDTSFAGGFNRVVGADVKWRLGATQRIEGFALASTSREADADRSASGLGAQVNYFFETEKWFVLGSGEHFDRDFEMATAFLNRVGITNGWMFLSRNFYPDKTKYPWLRRLSIISFTQGGEDRVAGRGSEFVQMAGLQFHLTRQGFMRVQRSIGFEHWQGQHFERGSTNAFGFIQLFRWLGLNASISRGRGIFYDQVDPFQGRARERGIGLTIQPNGRLSQEIHAQHIIFDRESTRVRVYAIDIVNTKTTYQFSRAFAIRGIAQYDSSRRRVLTDLLSSYEPRPGTVVYIGYGSLLEQRDFVDGQWVPAQGHYRTTQRGLFFKASYLYRF